MKLPLYGKVLLLALLNLSLLALALALIVGAQFRVDPGSFLLAPAERRIMSVAHEIALDLDQAPPANWEEILRRASDEHKVTFVLFDELAQRIGGPQLAVAQSVLDRIPRRERRRGQRAQNQNDETGDKNRRRAPALFLSLTANPPGYWAGARIPVRLDREENPHPGTLLVYSPSLLQSQLFFDFTPWLTIGAAVIFISALCWIPFIRGVTRSISGLTQAAGQIAEGQFEIHVDEKRGDEIGQLGAAVNRMASRLAGFVDGQKAFLNGIAHELCTPIATMQFGLSNLERKLSGQQSESISEIQEEVQHMSALVNELLSFTKSGMDALNLNLAPVRVSDVVARVLSREVDSETKIVSIVSDKLWVLAEPEYLFRALSNLVRNAVRYAGDAGPIEIVAKPEAGSQISVTVSDSGPGVPEDKLEQIFAPFYRIDAARSQETGGLGLGLAIVRNSVEACNGTVRCRNRKPTGLEVELRLPQAKSDL